ncbi:MAG: CoA pyrophosphatase [Chloroflexi bacterium]|nr:CoA pyrophosphatase [Chloroflexota bacterium]MBM3176147.1 CoA pyrophosphatase [Chloroflexota bacterium]MBM4450411.1 CoA pyrophosphatase [Chloroflexota bacterium]
MIICQMKKQFKKALSSRFKRRISDQRLVKAAVLLPLFYKDGQYHILFTRRSNEVMHHKGQISFPGGAKHDDDASLLDTALRESCEEIGLQAEDVEILGELDDAPTSTSNFVISPFVGFIPYPYDFRISRGEIDEIFDVPVSALLRDTNLKQEHHDIGGQIFTTYTYECGGRVIWGATAGILHQFLEIWKAVSGAQN